jgi:hypothetical protein
VTLLDDLPGWGAVLKLTGPTESVSVAQVNNRCVLKVGRDGTQAITIPSATTLIAGARLLILGDDLNLGVAKAATIADTAATISVVVDAYTEVYELLWTGSEWVIAGSATVAWGDVTGKPVLADEVADGFLLQLPSVTNRILVTTDGKTQSWSQITDAMVATGAAIAVTKLAAGAANTVLAGGASNAFTATPTVTSLTATSYVAAGGTPAVAGSLRTSHGGATAVLAARNYANNGDIKAITTGTADDTTTFGDPAVATNRVAALTSVLGVIGSTTRATLTASTLTTDFGTEDVQIGNGYVRTGETGVATQGQLRHYFAADGVISAGRFSGATLDSRILSFYGDGTAGNRRIRVGDFGAVGLFEAVEEVVVAASSKVTLGGTGAPGWFEVNSTGFTGCSGATVRITANATGLGFFAATPVAKPTVSGAKGSNVALGSLMTALSSLGLVTDSTTA